MPCVMMATLSPSTSDMGIPLLSQLSSKTVTFHQQPSVSSGLLFVFRTFDLAFTWITFSTLGSYSQHSTVQNVWHTKLCGRRAVAFLHRWGSWRRRTSRRRWSCGDAQWLRSWWTPRTAPTSLLVLCTTRSQFTCSPLLRRACTGWWRRGRFGRPFTGRFGRWDFSAWTSLTITTTTWMEPILRTSFGINIDRTTGCATESGGGRFSMRTKCTTVCTRWRRRNEQRHGDKVEQRGGCQRSGHTSSSWRSWCMTSFTPHRQRRTSRPLMSWTIDQLILLSRFHRSHWPMNHNWRRRLIWIVRQAVKHTWKKEHPPRWRRKQWRPTNLGRSGMMDSDTHHCRSSIDIANTVLPIYIWFWWQSEGGKSDHEKEKGAREAMLGLQRQSLFDLWDRISWSAHVWVSKTLRKIDILTSHRRCVLSTW